MPPRAKRAEVREAGRRQPLRLQRRAGEGALVRAGSFAQAGDANIRSGELRREIVRQFGVVQDHVLLQRGIAEQHVDELAGIVADGRPCEGDAHRKQTGRNLTDIVNSADDVVEDLPVVNRRRRHLDALLDRNALRPRRDGTRVGPDVIGGDEAGHGREITARVRAARRLKASGDGAARDHDGLACGAPCAAQHIAHNSGSDGDAGHDQQRDHAEKRQSNDEKKRNSDHGCQNNGVEQG
jgi:hypothetical protein